MAVVPDATIDARKASRRSELRRARAAIAADPADRVARSALIWERIVPLVDQQARVMLFDGLPTEPDTSTWMAWCAERGVEAFLPAVDGLDLRVVPGDINPITLDVVVVPGLGFTAGGARLGQGGGHYDRFLTRLRPDCVTIGACFAEQVVADLPTGPHDIGVDVVVTDGPS